MDYLIMAYQFLLENVGQILVAAVVAIGVAFVVKQAGAFKTRNPKGYRIVARIVAEGVRLAEEWGLDKVGEGKFNFALSYIQGKLNEKGLGWLRVDVIGRMINAEVDRQFNWEKLIE